VTALLGANVPTKGGLATAAANGRAIAADAIQIFTRNQVQWRAKPVSTEEAAAFRESIAGSGLRMVMTHGSYLVNLASPKADFLAKSRDAFLAEMQRFDGIPMVLETPGGLDAWSRSSRCCAA
jgi:deoxyribonuclease-4